MKSSELVGKQLYRMEMNYMQLLFILLVVYRVPDSCGSYRLDYLMSLFMDQILITDLPMVRFFCDKKLCDLSSSIYMYALCGTFCLLYYVSIRFHCSVFFFVGFVTFWSFKKKMYVRVLSYMVF